MKDVTGISLNKLPIQINEFVGVLLFQEFPVTSIYTDNKDTPIVREWIDCDDEIDRLLYYKSSKQNLKRFIEGEISQSELVKYCIDSLIFVSDEKDGKIINVSIISSYQIPDEYLFPEDSFFELLNGVETQKIIDYFKLNSLKIKPIKLSEHLKKVAIRKRSEVFNLHLKEGKGVGHGKIDTDVLGSTLLSFNNLYKEVALDYHFGINRGESKIPPKDRNQKLGQSSTEVFLNKAASYSVYIKPKHPQQLEVFEGKRISQVISENLLKLFEISKEKDNLKDNYLNYSDFVFKTYRIFLKNITEYDIKLDVDWTDHTTNILVSEDFTLFQASAIIDSIENINTEDTDSFGAKGKFRAINCNTGYFTFTSLDKQQYTGYFDKPIKESASSLTFTRLYEISIERKIIKEAGKPNSKIEDKIIAHYEINE